MSAADELLRDFDESDEDDLEVDGMQGMEDVDTGETTKEDTGTVKNDFEVAQSAADELSRLHKVLRDHYSIRFPELETLITNPINYAKTVAILKNGPLDHIKELSSSSDNMVGMPLKSILDGPSLMVVTVEGTSTRGREMTDAELQVVLDTCEKILKL